LIRSTVAPSRSTSFPYTTLFRSGQPAALFLQLGDATEQGSFAQQPVLLGAVFAQQAPLQQFGESLPRVLLALDRLLQRLLLTARSEEHTSELQSRENLVCRLLL